MFFGLLFWPKDLLNIKVMNVWSGIFLIIVILISPIGNQTPKVNKAHDVEGILYHFQHADAKAISAYFSSTLSYSWQHREGVFSKVHTERLLMEFFNNYPPHSYEVVHILDNNPNFRYVVFHLYTRKQRFKISIKLIAENKTYQLTELRIE
jgi:hypothetical protein